MISIKPSLIVFLKSVCEDLKMSWFLMNNKKKDDKKKDEIRRQFQKAVSLSNEPDGKLSRDQWTKVLIDAGIKKNIDEAEKLLESKDIDIEGRLSYEQFMGEETRAEKLFKLMDKDGDGYVTKNEFKEVCKNLSKDQIEATFRKFDQTGNDKLNLKEFSDMMSKRTDAAKKKSETLNKVVEDKR